MAKQSSKEQLLQDVQSQRRRLEKILSTLDPAAMTRPGALGTWSVKDVLAHLAAWEGLFLEWYRSGVQGSVPATSPVGMSQKAMQALNAQIYARNRGRSLEEVLAEFQASYRQIVAVLETIAEEDLFAPARFPWTGKLTLAEYVAGNTCNHYAWAHSQIRKWLKRQAGKEEQGKGGQISGRTAA